VTFGHHNTIQVLLREMPGIFSCNNIEKWEERTLADWRWERLKY
jgi:hypothetical protein